MNTRKNGDIYEQRAMSLLEAKGYVILDRQYRCAFGEVDIVARDGNCIVFAEVKHRKSKSSGDPLEAVTYKKMRRISMTARHYMMKHGISEDVSIRFDVIGYTGDEAVHIKNAFYYAGP